MKRPAFHLPAARRLVLFALLGSTCAARANPEKDVAATATALDAAASYQGGTLPSTGSDLTFTHSTYANTTFTLNNVALSIGTLNDLDIIQALTITASKSLTLNGGSNSVAGSATSDLLYLASGANLTYSGTGGIVLGASGSFDTVGTAQATINTVISGGSALNKSGAGTLTLTGTNTYSGGTSVSAGTLVALNNGAALASGPVSIASDAFLVLSNTGATAYNQAGTTFSGAGTLQKTGGGTVNLGGSGKVTVALAKGGLIDVQAGTLTGSSNYQGIYTNNQGSLNIAAGAVFNGVEGDIRVDALTGAGTLRGGFLGGTTFQGSTTIGVAGGYGEFTGTIVDNTTDEGVLSLTKAGTGTQTLSGNNTYTGGTTFAGGVLNAGSAGALGSQGTLRFTGGTLQYSAANQTDYSGRFSTAANQAYRIDTNRQNVTFATGLTSASGSLTKLGVGTLTLAGNNTYTGNTTVIAGTLNITGSVTSSAGSSLTISGPGNATLVLNGSLSTGKVAVGTAGSGTGDAYGSVLQNSGSFTTQGDALLVGYNGGTGTYTLNGGSLSTGSAYVGGNDSPGAGVVATGIFTQNGGTFTTNASPLYVGYGYIFNGTYILNGGTLTTAQIISVQSSGSTSTFNFNGGTLQAGKSTANFFGGLTTANVQAGGALIDTQGYNVTVAQSLLHDTTVNASAQDGGLTKLGSGTLILTGNNTYAGATTISEGTLQIGSGGTTGTLGTNTGTITDNGTLAFNHSDNVTLVNPISGSGGLTKLGTGTLTLTGASTYTGTTRVSAGTLAITGSVQSGGDAALYVDGTGTGAAAATLSLSGAVTSGVYNLSTGGVVVGISGSGTFNQSGGSFTTNGNYLYLGYIEGGSGTYTLSGTSSSLSTGIAFVGDMGTGTFNQSGGSFTTNGNYLYLGYIEGGSGTYNLSGGTVTTGTTQVGTYGNTVGLFTQTGGTHTTGTLNIAGYSAGSQGTYTLGGGTLNVGMVTSSDDQSGTAGTSIFHFAGGTLQASASSTGFLQGLTTADVQAGGARIDTQAYNVTVAQSLLHDTTSGAPTRDGGLTKLGSGTLTLAGSNTYTGGTLISAGTLTAASNEALGTGNVEIAAGARLTLNAGVVLAGMTGSTLTLDSATDSTVNLLGTGMQDTVATLVIAGITQLPGTYGALGSGATFVLPDFTGTGELLVTAVPEPGTWALVGLGFGSLLGLAVRRRTCFA